MGTGYGTPMEGSPRIHPGSAPAAIMIRPAEVGKRGQREPHTGVSQLLTKGKGPFMGPRGLGTGCKRLIQPLSFYREEKEVRWTTPSPNPRL